MQIGMRGNPRTLDWLQPSYDLGYNVVTMQEFKKRGIKDVIDETIDKIGDNPVYITFDLDSLDSAVAPAVSNIEPSFTGFTIDEAKEFFTDDQIIISNVDKKAYLSALKISEHIIVTCDSTSMISEAAITGKPIYVAKMPAIKNDQRFKNFFNLFESLNIIKPLRNSVENWNYEKLYETKRIAGQLKDKIKLHDFS